VVEADHWGGVFGEGSVEGVDSGIFDVVEYYCAAVVGAGCCESEVLKFYILGVPTEEAVGRECAEHCAFGIGGGFLGYFE